MRVESSAWMGVTNPRQRRTWVASNANWYEMLVRHRRQQKCLFLAPNEPTGPRQKNLSRGNVCQADGNIAPMRRYYPRGTTRVLSVGNMHSQSPLCPNCSRPMIVARTIPGVLDEPEIDEPEINVCECSRCRVDFITEDHLTISGTAVP